MDKLTTTVCEAVKQLTHIKKAEVLLNTALTLIEDGQHREEAEKYLDVYLETPGLPKEELAKALLARVRAQNSSGERLFAAQQVYHRVPPEIWEQIALHTPKYHLRTWLFVSRFHRDIASRHIFRTIDIYFGKNDSDGLIRGRDIFDRANHDPIFASRVKSLRVHWELEKKFTLDLMIHIFKTALPAFKALQDFEWIGHPALEEEMVQEILNTHKHLRGLGLVGWCFTAVGISAFDNLRKLTLRARELDMGKIRTILDRNERTLEHLIIGNFSDPDLSWDLAFASVTIINLTHLDVVDSSVSHFMLTRIVSAHNLRSLTLHREFVDLDAASTLFASDRIIDGSHTLLHHLEAFRLLLDEEVEHSFYQSVIHFLRQREKLRMLDLGRCPWDLVQGILPDLRNLRVLAVHIDRTSQEVITSLVESISREMVAIRLSIGISDEPFHDYACHFSRFHTLSFLHLQSCNTPKLDHDSEVEMEKSLRFITFKVPSLDFLVLDCRPFVIVRSDNAGVRVTIAELPTRQCLDSASVDFGGEDAAWLERKDAPIDY